MRKRFERQLRIGQLPISEIRISSKRTNALDQLIAALKEIYCNQEYSERIFCVLEEMMVGKDCNNGRTGMDLWTIFVFSQLRLCQNCSYDTLYRQANNDYSIRLLIGAELEGGFGRVEYKYQQIYDNVSLISDDMLKRINEIVVEFGHKQVFKKKETTALRLKTDSFVVESNVHFPTHYNLLWDCNRKCLDMIKKVESKYPKLCGWRKSLTAVRIRAKGGSKLTLPRGYALTT